MSGRNPHVRSLRHATNARQISTSSIGNGPRHHPKVVAAAKAVLVVSLLSVAASAEEEQGVGAGTEKNILLKVFKTQNQSNLWTYTESLSGLVLCYGEARIKDPQAKGIAITPSEIAMTNEPCY